MQKQEETDKVKDAQNGEKDTAAEESYCLRFVEKPWSCKWIYLAVLN